jgi:endonuclease III
MRIFVNSSEKIIKILQKRYDAKIRKSDPFRTLIGVILSHQTNDKISWPATDRLFEIAKAPEDFVKLGWRKIDSKIKNVNYHPTKAKRIYLICKMLLEKFDGKVPMAREELMELPGVGGKSADIVRSFSFQIPTIAIDTHVAQISRRLHWTKEKNPEKIKKDVEKIIPKKYWLLANSLLVDFGKEICASKPKCYICPIEEFCPFENKNLK